MRVDLGVEHVRERADHQRRQHLLLRDVVMEMMLNRKDLLPEPHLLKMTTRKEMQKTRSDGHG
jgi:hypothetical protein